MHVHEILTFLQHIQSHSILLQYCRQSMPPSLLPAHYEHALTTLVTELSTKPQSGSPLHVLPSTSATHL